MDVSPYLGEIVETEADREAGCFASLLAKVMGPPKLATAELKDERTRIFCCAKMKFDEADAMHFKCAFATLFFNGAKKDKNVPHFIEKYTLNDFRVCARAIGYLK
jgi:hypothetical protein